MTKRVRRWLALCALLAASVVGPGCGYTLAGRGSFLPTYIKVVGVPTFTNRSSVFNLETTLTEKVRAELIGRGKYTVLPQDTDVDGLLIGDVSSLILTPTAFNTANLASRYTITITASIQFKDVRENKVLWENPNVVFRQEYENTSGDSATSAAAFFGHEANALDRVASDFARTIVSAILEAF